MESGKKKTFFNQKLATNSKFVVSGKQRYTQSDNTMEPRVRIIVTEEPYSCRNTATSDKTIRRRIGSLVGRIYTQAS